MEKKGHIDEHLQKRDVSSILSIFSYLLHDNYQLDRIRPLASSIKALPVDFLSRHLNSPRRTAKGCPHYT